ncbi:MAG: porin, partial [Azonexus sp.]
MQKKLIALAIAAAASGAAFAQTNVTIYGIADVGYVGVDADGGKFQHNINSGVLSTSRIGFKGAEDLGNGLKAIFTLEYGLAMDQDAGIGTNGGGLGARQQFVGLTGGFGTVVAGRLQTAGLDYTVAGSALGGSAAVGAINQVSANADFPLLNSGSRANNAVAYISPSFGGVTVALNHSRLTESAADDDIKDNTATLVAVNYDGGPLTAGLVYGKVDVEKTIGTPAGVANIGGVVTPVPAVPTAKAKNADATEWGLRAGYDFGVAKLQAAYQRAKLEQAGGDLKNNRWILSATVPVTAKIG